MDTRPGTTDHNIAKEMKRLLSITITGILAIGSMFAQSSMIRLSYDYKWKFAGKENVHHYLLHTSADRSMFYNPVAYWMDQSARDEVAAQAYGTMAAAMQASGRGAEVPNRSVSMYIDKSFADSKKTVYDDFLDVFVWYDETFDEMTWDISPDSTQIILDYECVMAESDYHGRHWTAWFAPEIPIQDGPWKLAGLPGLILKATENRGIHSFIATGIEHTMEPVPEMLVAEWYHKENRKKYLQTKKALHDNPIVYLLADMPPGCKVFSSDGTEIHPDTQYMTDSNYDFLETDYH